MPVRRVGVACALVLGACGRIGFNPTSDAIGDSPPACALGPFSSPVKLPGPVSAALHDDWFPTPTLGETSVLFHSFRPPSAGADLWIATRPDLESELATPVLITELATADNEVGPTLTTDGLVLVYSTDPIAGSADLYTTTRASTADPWPPPTAVSSINSASTDFHPFMTGDGLRIVFASSRAGTLGGLDLFEASRTDRSLEFGPPRMLGELNTAVDDTAPTLSSDYLDIYFASPRPGGPGGLDVYTAHRATIDQPFGPASLISALSSAFDDFGLRLTPDGTTLYLNFDTNTSGGRDSDLWTSTRGCL